MKKISYLIVLAVLLLIPVISYSQGMRLTPDERAQRLKERLALTDSQTTLVIALYKKSQADMTKLFESSSDDFQARRQLMREMNEKTDHAIDTLLTQDQRKKFEEFRKQREQRPPRMDRRPND